MKLNKLNRKQIPDGIKTYTLNIKNKFEKKKTTHN